VPEKYLKLKQKFLQQGKSPSRAKMLAAKIYNSQRKPGSKPVSRKYHKKK
jgi:hypothetical protein